MTVIGRRCKIAGGCYLLWHGERVARCSRCRAWWLDGASVEDAVVGDQLRGAVDLLGELRDCVSHYEDWMDDDDQNRRRELLARVDALVSPTTGGSSQ